MFEKFIEVSPDQPFYKRPLILPLIIGIPLVIIVTVILIIVLTHKTIVIINPLPESAEFIANPDQGWFNHHFALINEAGAELKKAWPNPEIIHHLLCDLSPFSKANNTIKDKLLTPEALNGLEKVLQHFRDEDDNVVIRFFYDNYKGIPDKEPALDILVQHIKQIAKIVNKFPDVVTAIEGGFLGRWGEMFTSNLSTLENTVLVDKTWLENTNKMPILTRTPITIYSFYGKKGFQEMENVKITPNQLGYYLGHWNDGQYGSQKEGESYKVSREKEHEWLGQTHSHLPYGGEIEFFKRTEVQDISYVIPDMYKIHTSYLNEHYNKKTIDDIWKNQTYNDSIAGYSQFNGKTGFDFIGAHLGYRLVIKSIECIYLRSDFTLNIDIDNTGFGNVNKIKNIGLAFAYDEKNGNYTIFEQQNNIGTFFGGKQIITIQGKFPEEPKRDYGVYLRIYHETLSNGRVKYPIKFANSKIYNENVAGNFLFMVSKNNVIIKE